MSDSNSTRWASIGPNRRLVMDGLAFVPHHVLFPVDRLMNLSEIDALRKQSSARISWSLLFVKAYAAVCARTPLLRRAYIRWPWPHYLDQGDVAANLIINREHEEQDLLCWGIFLQPHLYPLAELQKKLDEYKNEPIDQVFRKHRTLARLPLPLRRLMWWMQINFSGKKRAKRLGTFTLSTLAGSGCYNRYHQTALTTSLTYGPLDENGRSLVTLICDHRVIDGIEAARALTSLEQELQTSIRDELKALA